MCDTLVCTPKSSADRVMIVGKNSDREPNEAQNITFVPASDHPAGGAVRCTYITIPQARHTCAVLLSRPFWMFGAEMGVNEHGVAIGNEAVFTKEKYHTANDALLGMDILRLALERSTNARGAIDVIINLLEEYGQGGVHTMGGTKYYHNSFIIADPENAYVFETAGKQWAYKTVEDIASISNCLTIDDAYDEASFDRGPGSDRRVKNAKEGAVHFTRHFSDSLFTHFARGRIRKSFSHEMMVRKKGSLTSRDMMNILRSHNMKEPYIPGRSPMERMCLHAGGLISSQTAGSMVALLKKGRMPLIYFTGTAAPCMSVYKPHTIGAGQNKLQHRHVTAASPFGGYDLYGSATDRWDRETLWWIGEGIHRRVLMNYSALMPVLMSVRDAPESNAIQSIEGKWKKSGARDFMALCDGYADELVLLNKRISERIRYEFSAAHYTKDVPFWFDLQWRRINKKAGFVIER